ncbi:MAG TPA: homoserine dehydrogenase [Kofleriaceae bacterium]|jgi:homoserine dehydrogenase|nr:homoserine dehydrogenase [Kofleriaceae bacterium]
MTRTIGVALLGLGNVGGGVVKLLEDNAAAIAARLGARLEVRAIAVRDVDKAKRVVEVDRRLLTSDPLGAVRRADVDIVCELIGGTTLAKDATLAAIAAGKHVVTANKALLAEHGAELFRVADRAGVDVYYEAAVCGGVPIIRVLREGLASDRVEAIYGIVNGTSNYILTTMTATRRAFGDILREAQALGYAEADPTLDIGGGDAAHKLAILMNLCFGTSVDVAALPTDGIDIVEPIDLDYADKWGYVIKPLVIARVHGDPESGPIEARIHPTLIPASWLLADVGGAKNAVYVQSYALGPSLYYGAGAGMLPTAMSVVSDMIEIGRNMFARVAGAPHPTRPRPATPRALVALADIRTRYYLRFGVHDKPGVLGQLMTILGAHRISIAQVVQDGRAADAEPVWVVVLTHEARERDVRGALAEINTLEVVRQPARLLRIATGMTDHVT